jgi:hypothetical protein
VGAVALDRGKKDLRGCLPDLGEVHIDRRERRSTSFCHYRPVVEADEHDVVGHLAANFPEIISNSARDLVASAEYGIDVGRLV